MTILPRGQDKRKIAEDEQSHFSELNTQVYFATQHPVDEEIMRTSLEEQ